MRRPEAPFASTLIVTMASVVALVACGRDDGRTAGQAVDRAVTRTEAAASRAADSTAAAVERAASGAEAIAASATAATASAAVAARDATASAMAGAAELVGDAATTTAIKAELARDPEISALRIDVDTKDGAVSLKGTAPSASARERATAIAKAVKGVVSVDNQLVIKG